MKKYEYKNVDLSPTWTLNNDKKQAEMIDRLNELGKDGWIAVSGFEFIKYTVFMREIPE
jgi:hypothetical protein